MLDPFFDELPTGICVSDDAGNILYINPSAQRTLDLTAAKSTGHPLCEFLCGHLSAGEQSECASACGLKRPSSDAQVVSFVGKYGPKDSIEWKDFHIQRRQAWKNIRVLCMKTPPTFLGEGRRLTLIEDRSAESDIERHKEEWRQMVAHDLRSPLTNIYAVIKMFQESFTGQSPSPSKNLVDISVRSCEKMVELLTLYLDVAKLDAGLMPVLAKPLALAFLVKSAREGQAPLAEKRRISVSASIPDGLFINADPDLFGRILENVLNNAVKYTPEDGSISITARVSDAQALIAIKDSGMGISPEDLPLLFDRFYQANARRAGKLLGTGLGLTFCREALKAMNGSIEVNSELGQGSEFIIRVPAAAKPQEAP